MRFAQMEGARRLRLYDCRHTYATLALEARRSIRFVADQLGHANPELTLRQDAHTLPLESGGLAFADFDTEENGSERLYPAPSSMTVSETNNAPDTSSRERYETLERETGIEPIEGIAFDTLSLGSKRQTNDSKYLQAHSYSLRKWARPTPRASASPAEGHPLTRLALGLARDRVEGAVYCLLRRGRDSTALVLVHHDALHLGH